MAPRNFDDRILDTSPASLCGDALGGPLGAPPPLPQPVIHPSVGAATRDRKVEPVKTVIVWKNVALWIGLHLGGAYGIYLAATQRPPLTLLFSFILYLVAALGVTAGAHRLWSHKSYNARFPLKLFLVLCNTVSCQNHIIEWARDHRVHHKYSETDADPHNAKRGFFFAHMGWLMVRKHPQVKLKGQEIDLSDLYADPLLRFQRRHYKTLALFFSFFLPTMIPMYFWDESFVNAYFIASILRYLVSLHCTWLVNSAAHMWGMRPYDETINPSENMLVTVGAIGEGYHNYHHSFPQDYRTSELGMKMNTTTGFINLMARIGMAYKLKTMSPDTVLARRQRTGDLRGTVSAANEEGQSKKLA